MPREKSGPCWENPIWISTRQQYCTDYYLAAVSAEGIPDALIPLPDLTGEVAYFSYSGVFRLCFAADGTMVLDCGGALLRFDEAGTYLGHFVPDSPVYSFGGTANGQLYLAVPGKILYQRYAKKPSKSWTFSTACGLPLC